VTVAALLAARVPLSRLEELVREGRVNVSVARAYFAFWVHGKSEFRMGPGGPEELLTSPRGRETWRPIRWLQ